MKYLIIILCLLSFVTLYSQENYIYLKNEKFPATENIVLINTGYYDTPVILRIGIDKTGGLIELSVETNTTRRVLIVGELQIFLENGNFIKCIDYGNQDFVSGRSLNIYKLTKEELEALINFSITKVRYREKDKDYQRYEDYFAENIDHSSNHKKVNTAKVVSELYDNNKNLRNSYNYKALIGAGQAKKEPLPTKQKISEITIKPNHFESGRKLGDQSTPELSGPISSITLKFSENNVIFYDEYEKGTFEIIDFEWINENKLWIDFSTVPMEFYLVIIFEMDGILFVNDENDPQPGEEYKALYFKELNKNDFETIYKKEEN